ncbi:MAG: cytochrome c-type biogenesis protein CcmH [Acidimicrobiia bacterium]|nr:cytochrome c-type biogenesis protein CcmH [Acidimicrobiia bacterium]
MSTSSGPSPTRRLPWWLPWAAMAVIVAAALAVGAPSGSGPPTNAERVQDLTRTIKCPQCAGQSVAESDVSVSREIRRDIATRVEEGQSDEQIYAYYAGIFGDDALLSPPTEGVGLVVWVLPVVIVVVGAGGVAVALRRWSAGDDDPSAGDRALVAQAMAENTRATPKAGGTEGSDGSPLPEGTDDGDRR